MSSSLRCSQAALAFAVAFAGGRAARAETPLYQGMYASLTAENEAGDLEVGLAIAAGERWRARPYLRVPLSSSTTNIVRVDGHAESATFGVGVDYGVDWTAATGPARMLTVSGQLEMGTREYGYQPLGQDASEDVRRQSMSSRLLVRYARLGPSAQVAPSLTAAYTRSYVEGAEIGVVVPGMDGLPDVVEPRVVAAPSTRPALSLRVGTALYLPTVASSVYLGAYLFASLAGDRAGYQPWGEGDTVRGELWIYTTPRSAVNSRAGLAGYLESRGLGDGDDRTSSFGLLLQLKLNTSLFEY